jgi:oligosaccharide repeat unit polymerase
MDKKFNKENISDHGGRDLFYYISPWKVTLVVNLPILFLFAFTPSYYFELWYKSTKISNINELMYIFLCVLLFIFGGWLGDSFLRTYKIEAVGEKFIPRWYIRSGLLTALLAYFIWFGAGILRSGGLSNLFDVYIKSSFYVKETVLKTIPGVTTFTQVAVAAIPVSLLCFKTTRKEKILINILLLFAIARAFLFSERLALLELLLPILVILFEKKVRSFFKFLLLTVPFVVMFFIVAEMRRAFLFVSYSSILDLFKEGIIRFTGYYLTSINNALFVLEKLPFATPLYDVFQFIWKFPGLSNLYYKLFGMRELYFSYELAKYGFNPEYNTNTFIGSLILNFGLILTPIFAFLWGVMVGICYSLARFSNLAKSLYLIFFVGLLEFMRINYLLSSRLIPTYGFFILMFLLFPKISKIKIKRRSKNEP